MAELRHDHTMSDAEALMWRLESDPLLSTTFANVTILDRAPDFELFRRRMERTSRRMHRLRQVVRTVPGNVGRPVWVDDPHFDVDDHLRRIALPKPGSDRQLLDLASLIAADPLDRSRPLWQFVVVEGLSGHRAALIEKLHHTISDGEAGVMLALEFLDFERDALEPPWPDEDATDSPDGDGFVEDPSAVMVRSALSGALRLPMGVAGRVAELLADPAAIPDASSAASETLGRVLAEVGDTDPALSPLWTRRSGRRRLEVATAPLEATRARADELGGTINTAFLAIAAEAAGAYHGDQGAPVEELRASMAVSTRAERSGTNAFSLLRFTVPTGDLPIDERFVAVRDAARAALDDHDASVLDTASGLSALLPTPVLTRLARQQAGTVDFATSNVRGSAVPVFVAGARMLHNYPVGPLAGVPFNLTLLSYLDQLDMGLNVDRAAVTEPELLRTRLEEAIGRFCA